MEHSITNSSLVKVSFIVTVIEKNFDDLLRFIDSYKSLDFREETELIIEAKELSENRRIILRKISEEIPQLRWFVNPSTSRCVRKDLGMMQANAPYLVYMDADCVMQKDYYAVLRPYLGCYKVIRGKNIYQSSNSRMSKGNVIYRTLCDDVVFRNETFTPNLIIQKEFLQKNGGWATDNEDAGDDYTLSQRLKSRETFEIYRCDELVVKIWNSQDEKWDKLKRTWIGYGSAYQVRRRNAGDCNWRSFLKNIPPFVFRRSSPLTYFPFAVLNWIVLFCGYLGQIRMDRKVRSKH